MGTSGERCSGVLLHVTSLPSRDGIGDLGGEAHRFVDFLAEAGQRYWQMLPLHPTTPAAGNSPYGALSAFALDPLLIGLDRLGNAERAPGGAPGRGESSGGPVDYTAVAALKSTRLRDLPAQPDLDRFREAHAGWLDDFTLFMALRDEQGHVAWTDWPPPLRRRDPAALRAATRRLAEPIEHHRRLQCVAFRQWAALREHADSLGVRLVGDVPFYLRHDSADVWAHQDLFKLDAGGRPTHVGGVPPDYYSATGQLWNSPVYRWDVLAERGYRWWLDRLRHAFGLFDRVRVDHFRGFAAHWEVPAGEETAENGVWVGGPGAAPFEAVKREHPDLPVIAEDLGKITPDVHDLIDALGLPGMRVLMFAFGDDYPDGPHLPEQYVPRCVVYTGTHDNNTARGWFEHDATAQERENLARHVGHPVSTEDAAPTLIRLAAASIADTVILPMQDVLNLDGTARMNVPSTPRGNWTWRLAPGLPDERTAAGLLELAREHGRS